MKDVEPKLGELIIDGGRRRDAVHVAIAPVTADCDLEPGQNVGFTRKRDLEHVGLVSETIGIVDPFLMQAVKKGERFWLFLYPNTVIGMRHYWKHPAFNLERGL